MCGLAGVAGNTSMKTRDAFLDLLLVTQLRGRDATGIFTVNNRDKTAVCKEVGPPDNLFDRKSFDEALRGVPKIMAGHCRAKTIGDNNRINAHPYDFDNLVGMHNGTLRGYHNMEGYDYKRTDSHALYHNIDRFGIDETILKLDSDGAYALVWWDKVDNRLNFLRNDKRPLWFAWTKDKTAVFWCSEPWMFSSVARHVDLWDGKDEGKEPVSPYTQLPPNNLWSFSINGFTKPGEKHLTFHQPRELKPEEREPVGFSRPSLVRGGEVANPFQKTCDAVYERFKRRQDATDTLKQLLDDDIKDLTNQEESQSTTPSSGESKKTSSNVLDFRRGLKGSTSSARSTLSLPQKTSQISQPNNKEDGTDGSKGLCGKGSNLPASQGFPRISLRTVAGIPYIAHKDTSTEIDINEFEARTGGKCTFCRKPIGDLSEVAAFTNKALSAFICTTCVEEPKVAVVG